MDQSIQALLAPWQGFYVIAGSAAGALIGLQFVVMALVADSRRRTSMSEVSAFGTPTVLHFSAAFLLSALSSMPWTSPTGLQLTLLACGAAGVIYTIVVILRARRTPNYQPQLEDWIWHGVLPFITYALLAVAGIILPAAPSGGLSLLAGTTLGLVFIGIHNSWDTITYVATTPHQEQERRLPDTAHPLQCGRASYLRPLAARCILVRPRTGRRRAYQRHELDAGRGIPRPRRPCRASPRQH